MDAGSAGSHVKYDTFTPLNHPPMKISNVINIQKKPATPSVR